jgi:hypothetical protein
MVGTRIGRERHDLALNRLGSPVAGPAKDVERLKTEQIGTPLKIGTPPENASRGDAASTGKMLRDLIVDFVMPQMAEPALLRADRSIPLLDHLVAEVLPKLDESEELCALATAIISDEIARQRNITRRIHEGLAA